MIVSALHSWELPDVTNKNKIKTTKKLRRNVTSKKSATFTACADYMEKHPEIDNNQEWADYFRKCGEGNLPKGFLITGIDLVSKTKRAGERISLSIEVDEQAKQLIDFFKRNDKTLNIVEKTHHEVDITDHENLKWGKIRKSVKYKLILIYIQEQYMAMGITDEKVINSTYLKIIDMIEVEGLNVKGTTMLSGKIDSFPCVKITKNGVEGVDFKSVKYIDHGYCDDFSKSITADDF
jgi:hypothetical protein